MVMNGGLERLVRMLRDFVSLFRLLRISARPPLRPFTAQWQLPSTQTRLDSDHEIA